MVEFFYNKQCLFYSFFYKVRSSKAQSFKNLHKGAGTSEDDFYPS